MTQILFFLCCGCLLATVTGAQNMTDVTRRADGYVIVYGPNHSQLASGHISKPGDDFGFSSCLLVNRRADGYTTIFDARLVRLASGYAGKAGDTFTVVGCTVVVKRKDGYTITFDKTLKQTTANGY